MESYKLLFSNINSQAIEVCQILQNAGYQAYIVGGCVRDLLLGVKPKDWDITTDALPEKVMSLFPKTYPTGLQHGTVTVAMGEGIENHFEVTTFRIEGEYKDGRRPEEVFFVMNIDQDLARRDFTINAIAFDPISNILIDPFNGSLDLTEKRIKAVGDPNSRFKEDGLRIMRAARFAARFGYTIDPETLKAMSENLNTLRKVSRERVRDEFCKILLSSNAKLGIDLLAEVEALSIVSPILGKHPSYRHFATTLHKCHGDLETRVAHLYLNVVPTIVLPELHSLKFSNKEIKRIIFLLELLPKFYEFTDKESSLGYKSFIAIIKNHTPDDFDYTLNQFIYLLKPIFKVEEELDKYKNEIVFSKREMQINGNDLLNIGISAGPQIKESLEKCYLDILRYPEKNNRGDLITYVIGLQSS
jgi:tRNA nucleotidyltransferase (CCA-adding enzyme)